MIISRREFIFSTGAAVLATGCRSSIIAALGGEDLRFGVASDIHITTPKSALRFERALRYFKGRCVDAVVVPGDLTDWGLKSSLGYVRTAWDRALGGSGVAPLFCTGNHDYDGWGYGDMAVEMHANGYSEEERLAKDMPAAWKAVFGTDFSSVRLRTVRGYDFVSLEFGTKIEELRQFLAENGKRLGRGQPWFYFQHYPLSKEFRELLDTVPGCIAITGHEHRPFVDERCIRQDGKVTEICSPSLSYLCLGGGRENGDGPRNGTSKQAMPNLGIRRDLRGGQGFVVIVKSDRVIVERIDLDEETDGAPDWVVPLKDGEQPFAAGVREKSAPVPQFPEGAELDVETRNTENRSGSWIIALNCEFPSAEVPSGQRVFDYEIKAVPADGSKALVKRFFSPAIARLPKYEPKRQRFWFDVAELPQAVDYNIEVRARNCFGKAGEPIVAGPFHGLKGKSETKK